MEEEARLKIEQLYAQSEKVARDLTRSLYHRVVWLPENYKIYRFANRRKARIELITVHEDKLLVKVKVYNLRNNRFLPQERVLYLSDLEIAIK